MAEYRDGARRVARVLSSLPGVRVTPDPPQANLFHAFFPVDGERLLQGCTRLAETQQIALFTRTLPCDVPGYCAVEVSIGDAATAIDDSELRQWMLGLLAG